MSNFHLITDNDLFKMMLLEILGLVTLAVILIGLPVWKIVLAVLLPLIIKFVGGVIIGYTNEKGGDSDGDWNSLEESSALLQNEVNSDTDGCHCCGQHCQCCVCDEQHDTSMQDCGPDEVGNGGGTD